jgi:HlyD family secretion protein
LAQQLVPLSRVSALEREAARLDGVRGQLISGIAQTEGKISEARLMILQIDSDLFSEVGGELRDLDAKIGPLEEQLNAAQDQLSRISITAPEEGVVHQLNVKTIGGVVGVGEVLMLIVPTADKLAVEAQINPTDIDQIRIGAALYGKAQ